MSWRWSFLVVAALGVPVAAACLLCIADPRRGVAPPATAVHATSACAHLVTSVRALWATDGIGWFIFAIACQAVGGGTLAFTAPLLQVKFGLNLSDMGSFGAIFFGPLPRLTYRGLCTHSPRHACAYACSLLAVWRVPCVRAAGLLPGVCSIVGGAFVSHLVSRFGSIQPMLYVPIVLALPMQATRFSALTTDSRTLSLAGFAASASLEMFGGGGQSALIQTICPRGTRAVAITLLLFIFFFGSALGAPLTGLLVDQLQPVLVNGSHIVPALSTASACTVLTVAASTLHCIRALL
jgi:hypothetical protein